MPLQEGRHDIALSVSPHLADAAWVQSAWWIVAVSAILSLAFMYPRVLDAQFGFLDDGKILVEARAIEQAPSRAITVGLPSGRFVPAFWAYYTGLYVLAGADPAVFFLANWLILWVLIATAALLVRATGAGDAAAWLSGAYVLTAGPVPEAFYTACKTETLQTLCVSGGLLLAWHAAFGTRARLAAACGSTGALVLAGLLKETSVVLVGVAVCWGVVGFTRGTLADSRLRRALLVFSVGAAVSLALFLASRSLFLPAAEISGRYASNFVVSPERIGASALRLAKWLIHGYLHLLVLGTFAVVRRRDLRPVERGLLIAAVAWMACWAAVYLPWHSLLSYYLLPFSMGAAVFAGTSLAFALRTCRGSTGLRRVVPMGVAALVVALCVCNLVNYSTQAAIQLLQDRSNAYLIQRLVSLPSHAVVLLNVDAPNEYMYEIGVHVNVLQGREDVTVDYLTPATWAQHRPNVASRPIYLITPTLRNQFEPSVRMAVSEVGAEARLQTLPAMVGPVEQVWDIESRARLSDVGFDRLFAPASRALRGYAHPHAIMHRATFAYGWTLSRPTGAVQ